MRVMDSKSDDIEIMIYDKADNVIEEIFKLLLKSIRLGWKH